MSNCSEVVCVCVESARLPSKQTTLQTVSLSCQFVAGNKQMISSLDDLVYVCTSAAVCSEGQAENINKYSFVSSRDVPGN